jgi:nucleoside-diphosphate-sugar epimerase
VSSTSVYRDSSIPFARGIDETAALRTFAMNEVEQYGLSKIEAERRVFDAHNTSRLPFVIIRAPVVFGTGDGWDNRLLNAVRGRPWLTLSQLPTAPTLQCVHVDDLARGILLAASHPAAANQIFNMAGSELFSLRDVGRMAMPFGIADRDVRVGGDLKYDIGKARAMIGYAPRPRVSATVLSLR